MPGGGSRKKFSDVATLVISRAEVQNGQRKCRWTRVRDYKSVYRCHCAEYFSAYEVREIGHQELVDFLDYLVKKQLSQSTIRHVTSFVRKVLVASVQAGVVRSVPGMPKR